MNFAIPLWTAAEDNVLRSSPCPIRTATAATREKIVDSARRLFNRRGFDNVTVKQIMAGAGLTHGGFYGYFKGKSDLYTQVLGCFFTDPNWKPRWKGVHIDPEAGDVGRQIIGAYLSRAHLEDVANSCPLVALPTDVQRNGKAVREAFEEVFLAMVGLIEQNTRGRSAARRKRAQAIAAMCIGGLIVARTVGTHTVADQLRQACMDVALGLLETR